MKMNKKEIRKQMLQQRDSISDKQKVDDELLKELENLEEFKNSENFFVYVSFGSEFNTHKLIKDLLEQEKKVYVPYVKSKGHMIAVEIKSMDDLAPGAYGILEPKNPVESDVKFDFMLVPGLCFDKNKYRIGYGGGFYDRFIDKIGEDSYKVSIVYDFQLVDDLHPEEFDRPVDKLIIQK